MGHSGWRVIFKTWLLKHDYAKFLHFMFNMRCRWIQVFLPWWPLLVQSGACRWLLWAPLSEAPQTFYCKNVHVCGPKHLHSSGRHGTIIHINFFLFFFLSLSDNLKFPRQMCNLQSFSDLHPLCYSSVSSQQHKLLWTVMPPATWVAHQL